MADPATTRPAVTPSQTVGPYFHIGMAWDDWHDLAGDHPGDPIVLTGRVLDGADQPIPDAAVEIWQADPEGRYNHPDDHLDPESFLGWGRVPTGADGSYRFRTVVPGEAGGGPPHVAVVVHARGLLDQVHTRAYLAAADDLAGDPVAAAVPEDRRAHLCAVADGTEDAMPVWRFDIRMQGPDATPFLEFEHPGQVGRG